MFLAHVLDIVFIILLQVRSHECLRFHLYYRDDQVNVPIWSQQIQISISNVSVDQGPSNISNLRLASLKHVTADG